MSTKNQIKISFLHIKVSVCINRTIRNCFKCFLLRKGQSTLLCCLIFGAKWKNIFLDAGIGLVYLYISGYNNWQLEQFKCFHRLTKGNTKFLKIRKKIILRLMLVLVYNKIKEKHYFQYYLQCSIIHLNLNKCFLYF